MWFRFNSDWRGTHLSFSGKIACVARLQHLILTPTTTTKKSKNWQTVQTHAWTDNGTEHQLHCGLLHQFVMFVVLSFSLFLYPFPCLFGVFKNIEKLNDGCIRYDAWICALCIFLTLSNAPTTKPIQRIYEIDFSCIKYCELHC